MTHGTWEQNGLHCDNVTRPRVAHGTREQDGPHCHMSDGVRVAVALRVCVRVEHPCDSTRLGLSM